MLLVLVGGLGCEPAPTDRERYVSTLGLDHDAAAPICARIDDPGLRGECLSHAATEVAPRALDTALATCAGIDDPVWSDECAFLVADVAALVGEPARSTCEAAGRFRDRCVQHAAHRELLDRVGTLPVGEEARLETVAAEVAAAYNPGLDPFQLEPVVDAAIARVVSSRWDAAPFDVADCGVLAEPLCVMAYGIHLMEASASGVLQEVCAGPLEADRVAAAGAVAWVAGDPLAPKVWARTCADLRRKARRQQRRRQERVVQ